MNVLLVLAHPEPRSFNGALRDAALVALQAAGHRVEQSDLYATGWQPVLGPAEFGEAGNGEPFNAQQAQRRAVAAGSQSADVVAEQAKLQRADLLLLIFPIWWFGMPAILKGWIDRVLALDVAYGGGRWFDQGVYRGKRALICTTTGARADRFSESGLFGPLDWVLHPLRVGTLNFCGFETLEPFVAWAAAHRDEAGRRALLDRWTERLARVEHETPQAFRHLADFTSPSMRDHR
ncbi:MAG TPA: NAD(P)H-dependent oxidoreductase [Burkholderiaceae bacterium]|nr:NAD(P)H-dependent oxidoreductase [Burkholderiaceae bacterium]